MSVTEVVLWAVSYALIGICVFTAAVREFRKREWLTYEDLFEISLPFLFFWPLGLGFILFSKIKDSEFSYKILKLINGR